MSIELIKSRLEQYQTKNQAEQENAFKEITQEVVLSGLARAGFFKNAVFQGGTCLRILYGLNRFSEDLDFALIQPNSSFEWKPFLYSLKIELEAFGYHLEVQDRSSVANPVKVGFLKEDSLGKLLFIHHRNQGVPKAIKIKLEIDTNPPAGGAWEEKFIDFPVTVPVLSHDLPSLFAGKSHALLCRPWEKGRDWYDFNWYVGRKSRVNFDLLTHAIHQAGPWKAQQISVNKEWYLEKIRTKIRETDWDKQKKDVVRFLKQGDLDLLSSWSTEFFLNRVGTLEDYLL